MTRLDPANPAVSEEEFVLGKLKQHLFTYEHHVQGDYGLGMDAANEAILDRIEELEAQYRTKRSGVLGEANDDE